MEGGSLETYDGMKGQSRPGGEAEPRESRPSQHWQVPEMDMGPEVDRWTPRVCKTSTCLAVFRRSWAIILHTLAVQVVNRVLMTDSALEWRSGVKPSHFDV